jgi:hypothetical protein
MSLFPALLVGVVLLGLIGQPLHTAVNSRAGSSTALLIVGLGIALYKPRTARSPPW